MLLGEPTWALWNALCATDQRLTSCTKIPALAEARAGPIGIPPALTVIVSPQTGLSQIRTQELHSLGIPAAALNMKDSMEQCLAVLTDVLLGKIHFLFLHGLLLTSTGYVAAVLETQMRRNALRTVVFEEADRYAPSSMAFQARSYQSFRIRFSPSVSTICLMDNPPAKVTEEICEIFGMPKVAISRMYVLQQISPALMHPLSLILDPEHRRLTL